MKETPIASRSLREAAAEPASCASALHGRSVSPPSCPDSPPSCPEPMDWPSDADPALVAIHALLAATPAALCVLDAAGRLVAVNPAFLRCWPPAVGKMPGEPVLLPAAGIVTPFSPDGQTVWRLCTLPEAAAIRAVPAARSPVSSGSAGLESILQNALDTLPVLFNIKDPQGRYRFMNAFQAEVFGLPVASCLGRTAQELLGGNFGGVVQRMDQAVGGEGQALVFIEDQFAGADGLIRDWLLTKIPTRNAAGGIDGIVTLGVDITTRKKQEEALTLARADAEETTRSRTRFLASVGHELRMPLNAIIGFAEFLQEESLGALGHPTYREYAGDILEAGRHLLTVINDILDMARIEAGRLTLEDERVATGREVSQVVRLMAIPALLKRITLDNAVPLEAPVLRADPRRLRQILLNLISNAVKFTPEGGCVTVSLRQPADGSLVLVVQDTGVGIAPEHMVVALSPFGRIENALTRREEGTGLGLPLAKALLESHGGRLELISAPQEGTQALAVFPAFRVEAMS